MSNFKYQIGGCGCSCKCSGECYIPNVSRYYTDKLDELQEDYRINNLNDYYLCYPSFYTGRSVLQDNVVLGNDYTTYSNGAYAEIDRTKEYNGDRSSISISDISYSLLYNNANGARNQDYPTLNSRKITEASSILNANKSSEFILNKCQGLSNLAVVRGYVSTPIYWFRDENIKDYAVFRFYVYTDVLGGNYEEIGTDDIVIKWAPFGFSSNQIINGRTPAIYTSHYFYTEEYPYLSKTNDTKIWLREIPDYKNICTIGCWLKLTSNTNYFVNGLAEISPFVVDEKAIQPIILSNLTPEKQQIANVLSNIYFGYTCEIFNSDPLLSNTTSDFGLFNENSTVKTLTLNPSCYKDYIELGSIERPGRFQFGGLGPGIEFHFTNGFDFDINYLTAALRYLPQSDVNKITTSIYNDTINKIFSIRITYDGSMILAYNISYNILNDIFKKYKEALINNIISIPKNCVRTNLTFGFEYYTDKVGHTKSSGVYFTDLTTEECQ